ncbi:endonuclease/exonuclease/phosphatase family protein [Mycoplasmatota bacterium WC30]
MKLKLLTLNLHCFAEQNIEQNQKLVAEMIIKYDVDIVFLQEVAQTMNLPIIKDNIKENNYGYMIQQELSGQGYIYNYYYEPIKESFGSNDEGLGIISKKPLKFLSSKYISKTIDYGNWKTRKVLAYELETDSKKIALATTHFGWSDGYEVFEEQFTLATEDFINIDLVILAGDFNIVSDSKEYKYITKNGWNDVFYKNPDFKNTPTFRGDEDTMRRQVKIDYIMTNKEVELLNQKILFIEDRVSDHYGVFAEIEV